MRSYRAFVLATAVALCGFAANAATPATNPATPETNVQPRGNPLWAIPLNVLNVTRERPIFLPSRRPPAPIPPASAPVAAVAPPPARPAEPERLALRLLGTVEGGDSSIAICLNQTTNDVVRLRKGENFEGWVLRSVRRREVEFEKLALREILSLTPPGDSQPAVPPQVVAGTPPVPQSTGVSPAFRPQDRPPVPQSVVVPAKAPPPGSWVDGDGQVIDPPKPR